MNILLTDICNQRCNYCFAKGKIAGGKAASKGHYITLDNFRKALEFAKRSNEKRIGILGGEPTLHPQFIEAVQMALSHGFSLNIFTNGFMNGKTLSYLKTVDPKRVLITLNVNYPASYGKGQWVKLNRVMRELSKITIPGHTMHDLKFCGKWLIGLVKKYNLPKKIRLGMAAPLYGTDNKHLSFNDHAKVGKMVARFSRDCDRNGIQINFDCGFRTCDFSREQAGQMYYDDNAPRITCYPAIDVNIDLTVWRCFATSGLFDARLGDFDDLEDVQKYFYGKFNKLRALGAGAECRGCKHFTKGACSGGCIGYTLKTFRGTSGLAREQSLKWTRTR